MFTVCFKFDKISFTGYLVTANLEDYLKDHYTHAFNSEAVLTNLHVHQFNMMIDIQFHELWFTDSVVMASM